MTPHSATVSSELLLRLVVVGSSSLPVRACLSYDVLDPYAVCITFHTGSGHSADTVEWTFARQLLTDGVASPVGQGDVRVWPSVRDAEAIAFLSLSSPAGKALFELPVDELVEFLAMTYDAVPTGGESTHMDVDAELALLLWAQPET